MVDFAAQRTLSSTSLDDDAEPIREELFSVERLEQHAGVLAAEHTIRPGSRTDRSLLPRVARNSRKLAAAYRALTDAIRQGHAISPAAEWLVDNFHVVQEQLREIREDLPRGYYNELPKLATGKLKSLPRIYAIALTLVAHTDSRLEAETIRRFVRAYQQIAPLTIGELWAIAITLRLALVENLQRLTTRVVAARIEREEADALADELLEMTARDSDVSAATLVESLSERAQLDRAFVVQLTQRLRDQDPAVMGVFDWLERKLAAQNQSVEQIVQLELQRQAAAQVTVGNIITSMKLLSTLDWRDFFESVSVVDPVLARDPANAYPSMDFATRDRYRHVVERIAKRTKTPEIEVAARAVTLAEDDSILAGDGGILAQDGSPQTATGATRAHVGYYLIDDGCKRLEAAFGYRPRLRERLSRLVLAYPTVFYLGTLALLTALILALLVADPYRDGASVLALIGFALVALIPASDLALSVLNWDVTHLFKPRVLPKMNFEIGIPAHARTMVVVPTLLTSGAVVEVLLEKLEVHFLANQDEQLYFALLGDLADAAAEEAAGDSEILEAALQGIERLNKRYPNEAHERFHLFHRRRQWNAGEGKWLGWERKRGKLEEFNALLRGKRETSFIVATANGELLASIRYVITLDSDTQLPRDAAHRLVGTIAHPLNQARLDTGNARVSGGYGILQPRVSVTLESGARSRFARIFSGNTGIDPYTTAASDVYQDLFAEGSFTGKGLYDVDAFEAALAERVPENTLLSHDLFEGLYARVALVSDIELLDDYPAHYDTYAKRQHRWTRGDWQIARWLLPRVPDAQRRKIPNRLPPISRWKILDNLRRSLVAPTLLLMLVTAWTVLPGSSFGWTLFVVAALAFPIFAHVTTSLLLHPRGIGWTSHFWHVWGDLRTNAKQVGLTIAFLAHQAFVMLDAIARTIYRKLISRKNLLEWTTAAQAEQMSAHDSLSFLRFMRSAVIAALVVSAFILLTKPAALLPASPFLLAWLLSPLIAYYVSRRPSPKRLPLGDVEKIELRSIARRTWRFFERFVGTEDNWLPPDNFQEDPYPVVAHRTSPTNIGLLLLSTFAARDFGYIGSHELAERLELTFATLGKMQKFRGHFFNWYDTRNLEPLTPQYVSTVDSGNLAGHLIAVRGACLESPQTPLFDDNLRHGLADTIKLMQAEAMRLGAVKQRTQIVTVKQLRLEIDACSELVNADAETFKTLDAWAHFFAALANRAAVIEDITRAMSREHDDDSFAELHFWIDALKHQTRFAARDLHTLVPWADSLAAHLAPVFNHSAPAIAAGWQEITELLDRVPSLAEIPERCDHALALLAALRAELKAGAAGGDDFDSAAASNGLGILSTSIEDAARRATELIARFNSLASSSDRIVEEMDFAFLFDEERKVFRIGYSVGENRGDNSFYDLLASESRLTSFVAIAKGDAVQEHWFLLGRQMTRVNDGRALVSWTATMFEYLMPLLVMRNYDDTLLNQTCETIVRRQIEYGRERAVAWGISESAYNARDLHFNYQYGPFGVPGLGLKRGLSEDLVIAPYATALAALVEPRLALDNMRRLAGEGVLARYGFYEAVDYTPERVPQNQKRSIIRSFMAHHQGMTLVALGNVINDCAMVRRFHAEPMVQATELLLQERIPRSIVNTQPRAEEVMSGRAVRSLTAPVMIRFDSADLPTPRTQLLSNGTYSVMMTTAGAGYSMCGNLAVTRWREDVTRDNWGSFCYLRDVQSGAVWSTGINPTRRTPQSYEVIFSEDKAEFKRLDIGIVTHTEIIVSPEDNAEVRRVSLTNKSTRVREIEVTSYMEVVLAPPAADLAHPAFSNLFIETEFIANENALIARRRPRSPKDAPVWGVHTVVVAGETVGAVQYETHRRRFLGRGHDAATPVSVIEDRPLSNSVGTVLDPIFSLRQRIRLQPNETAHVTFSTSLAHTREEALMLADKYHDPAIFARVAALAWTKSRIEMRHLNMDSGEAHLFQRLAGRVLYSDSSLRPRPHVLAMNTKTQSGLWAYGISGDLPIVLVRISSNDDLHIVRQLLRGHEYLRLKGLAIDLVLLNDHPPSYIQSLQDELQNLIRATGLQTLQDKPGGVFLRRTDIMPEADKILLHTIARVVIVTERGALEDQLVRRPIEEDELPPLYVARFPSRTYAEEPAPNVSDLSFFNGLGGFTQGGREYVTILNEGQWTPAPWANVIANNQEFGFQVTETGAGYTWSVNSRENRLTPWSNDAVSDPPGETIYLRDEETGTVWTPTPLPIREASPYHIRHGQGYTSFEHASHGIRQELTMFVPLDGNVKISRLRLRNDTTRHRRLSVTSYNEIVLGVSRTNSAPFVVTEYDKATNSVLARNKYNNEFADRVAFVAMSPPLQTVTCDRKTFLGRNGSLARPDAMRRVWLANHFGAGLDPCIAAQTVIDFAPGEEREVIVLLGQEANADDARATIKRFLAAATVEEAFRRVGDYWSEVLDTIIVRTPDPAMDVMLNRWLPYQNLACRVWARSAFYQSGGAYGFRDQLQDVMALVYSQPHLTRGQILRAAAHQFKEGDVQHWWHPPTGRGVRTRFSDDLLWLPYVTSFYINATGDRAVLDEVIPFIETPLLAEGEDETYTQPVVSQESASLYEHCVRALERSLATGAHALPLMGSGDWNDGMNRVGNEGRGESVWVGWFLYTTLESFAKLCDRRGDAHRANRYREHIANLKIALEEHGWDGDWYRRAYFDDGTPLGSAQNEECRIDSIVQSWGVISGAADPQRAAHAMAAVDRYLVRRGDGIVLLFTPPFDHSALEPGYIKGYVPGVRENGGQYTHAALWTLIAFAELGDGDRAGELFTLLNPISHASTRAGLHKYRVEPYVAAGDVYAVPPHTGRGGWTWYTGSAGWMYRAGLESILGFRLMGERLRVEPCIPRGWREYEMIYRRGATEYRIKVENPRGVCRGVARAELDGELLRAPEIPLADDGGTHTLRLMLGEPEPSQDELLDEKLHEQTARA